MSDLKDVCPTSETILKYFYMDLDRLEMRKVEEHFSQCDQCLEDIDYYKTFAEQIKLSSRFQKEIWLNSNTDTFSVAAAGSYDNSISELKSSDGKYILQKIPYLEDEKNSLLVIKLTDPNVRGKLSLNYLDDSGIVLIGSALIDNENKACFDVATDIKLKNLLITVI